MVYNGEKKCLMNRRRRRRPQVKSTLVRGKTRALEEVSAVLSSPPKTAPLSAPPRPSVHATVEVEEQRVTLEAKVALSNVIV